MATGGEKKETVKLYHYTSKEGSEAILKEKRITASTDAQRDAVFGKGVYLTSIPPSEVSKSRIMVNNYDNTVRQMERQVLENNARKIEKVVEVVVPKDSVERVRDAGGRDVFKTKKDIDLNKCSYRIIDGPKKIL